MRGHVAKKRNRSHALVIGDAEWPVELMRSPWRRLAGADGDPLVAGIEDDPTRLSDCRPDATPRSYHYWTDIEAGTGQSESGR